MQQTVHIDHFTREKVRERLEGQIGPQLRGALDIDIPDDLPLTDWWALTLIGKNGSGKSWLAVRVLFELSVTHRTTGRFQNCLALTVELSDAIEEGGYNAIMRRLIETPILVLDDVMRIRFTDNRRDVLKTILHLRHEWQRTTILTADKSPKTLDPAIYSRLSKERGGLPYTVRRNHDSTI